MVADVALPRDVAIREESLRRRRVELLDVAPHDVTVLEQPQEELLRERVVRVLAAGLAEVVELDLEQREGVSPEPIAAVDELAVGNAFLLRTERVGDAMVVRAADGRDVAADHSVVADEDVERQVGAAHMAEVRLSVGVRQRRGDEKRARHDGRF